MSMTHEPDCVESIVTLVSVKLNGMTRSPIVLTWSVVTPSPRTATMAPTMPGVLGVPHRRTIAVPAPLVVDSNCPIAPTSMTDDDFAWPAGAGAGAGGRG